MLNTENRNPHRIAGHDAGFHINATFISLASKKLHPFGPIKLVQSSDGRSKIARARLARWRQWLKLLDIIIAHRLASETLRDQRLL